MNDRPREGPSSGTTRVVTVGGVTRTAAVPGISAAGSDPGVMVHTPSADLEVLTYGRPTRSPVPPVSPTGCPTPAVVGRAVLDLYPLPTLAVDAGLARPTGAPTVDLDVSPGGDVRGAEPVPDAATALERARGFAGRLPASHLMIGETIPGGTTTALGVLAALGERATVSSSLPENPLERKRGLVERGLAASDLERGDLADQPTEAVRRMGDPVLGVVAGLILGADDDATVTLAGGTQLAAAAALVRHAGAERPLDLATTSFVAADESADLASLAADLGLEVTVTDPGFESLDHPAGNGYLRGEAKEGVGMGGFLALADRAGVPMTDVRERVAARADELLAVDHEVTT